MLQNKRHCRYPLQKQLFDQLKSKYKMFGKDWLEHYMSEASLTKTPAYARLSGDTPIPFDEGVHLMFREHVLLDYLPPRREPDTETVLLSTLRTQVHSEHPLVMLVHDLPCITLSHARTLACFKTYTAMYLSADVPYCDFPEFNYEWMAQANVNNRWELNRTVEYELSRHRMAVVYATTVLDTLLQQAAYVVSIGRMGAGNVLSDLAQGFKTVFNVLKQRILHDDRRMAVYENTMFSTGNQLLMPRLTGNPALFTWNDNGALQQLNANGSLQRCYTNALAMLNRCQNLSRGSEANRAAFLERFENRLIEGLERVH